MKALILAGGRGKRLRPITDKIPKPLILINNTPLIERSIKYLKKFGINDIIICSGYKSKQIENFLKKKRNFNCKIEFSIEKTPLGTAGAIKKATDNAKNNLQKIPLRDGRTLHHDVLGKDGAGKVLLRSAPSGTGIIAGGPIRAACEVIGIKDIVAKSLGSSNPINVLRACVKGLKSQSSPKHIANVRGKKIAEITRKKQ